MSADAGPFRAVHCCDKRARSLTNRAMREGRGLCAVAWHMLPIALKLLPLRALGTTGGILVLDACAACCYVLWGCSSCNMTHSGLLLLRAGTGFGSLSLCMVVLAFLFWSVHGPGGGGVGWHVLNAEWVML